MAGFAIARRFRGPDDSGNGGYACGRVAGLAALERPCPGSDPGPGPSGEVEVTLRLPLPLETPLEVAGGRVTAGGALVAEYGPAAVELELPAPPSFDDAVEAQHPDVESPFPHCFVCGVRRAPDDGLHLHPGPLGRDGLVAAPWVPRPDTAGPEFVWCALDCPGAYAAGLGAGLEPQQRVGLDASGGDLSARGVLVLGRMAARVLRTPAAGERCVVAGWPLGSEGRKRGAGTAVWSAAGELLGLARATWIEPRS